MARVWLATVVLAATAGCDWSGGLPERGAPDARAPDRADAGRGDAGGPDASPADAGLTERRLHVLDSMVIPATANEALAMALDLDGDTMPDNAFGGLLAILAGQLDISFNPPANAAIAGGSVLELVDADIPTVRVGPGEDLDGDPTDNLSGSEPLAFTGEPEPAPGLVDSGVLEAGPGAVTVRLALFDGAPPVDLPGVATRLRASVGVGLADGHLAFGLREDVTDSLLVPYLHAGFAAMVAADCPGGVCAPDSAGGRVLVFFDDNENGQLEYREVRRHPLINSTLGNPDLDLLDADGEPVPDGDGVRESLSFGLGFTAVIAAIAE